MTHRTGTVLAARTMITIVLLGVPAVLVVLAGDPLPSGAQWSAIVHLEPDWGNTVLLGNVLPCLAWIAWALFAYPLIGELLRHRTGHRVLPVGVVLRGQQQVAAALVTAALLSSSPALAAPRTPTTQTERVTDIHSGPAHVNLVAFHSPARDSEAGSHRSQVATSTVTSYEVREGDTLWGIAERRLGDGADYPAIVEQSAHVVQPGGRHLTDPDLILPGWHLDIPATAPPEPHASPTAPPVQPGPSPTTATTPPAAHTSSPKTPASSDGAHTETVAADPDPDPAAGAVGTADARDGNAVPIAIGGGAAAILAAGLITALTRRRRQQRTERRFGERLPLPSDGPTRDLEEQLRAVSDPTMVASLHRALASVLATARQDGAPLPSLFAVRIDENDLTLYLYEPATLPNPFQPLFTDGTAWTAPRDAFTIPVEPYTAAPYPALVTVGTDLDGGILLLDLEQQGHLSLSSTDSATARGLLNAITAELASSPWGEDIHLSLVGVPERLAMELDPYRIQRVADTSTLIRDIRTHLADRRAALDTASIPDVRTARTHVAEDESWAPFIVLIGTRPTPEERTALEDLLRQYASAGLVIVTTSPTETGGVASIAVTETSATFQSDDPTLPPLPFIPQLLDEHTLEQTLQIFTQTAAPAEDLQQQAPQPARLSPTQPRSPVYSAGTPIEYPDTGAPFSPRPAPSMPVSSDASRASEQAAAESEEVARAPYLHLLGQVEIHHVDRPELIPGRGVELLAYLLHHRQPAAGAQIQKALWPASYDRTNGNLRSLAKQVRAALGHDPDGHLWLPEGRGNAGFTTHPDIRSDWQHFKDLTGPDPTSVRTEQLATALRLVHGQPLLGTDGHRGRWAWRTPLEETIIATIQDVAVVVAERAIKDGDRALVKLAVRAARFADPLSELSWQIELRAAITAGTPGQVDRIVADLHAAAGHGNPDYEPDDETITLIRIARSAIPGRRP